MTTRGTCSVLMALAFALTVAGCGGGGGGAVAPPPTGGQTGLERLTVTIPAKSSSLIARTPRYISTLTQSVTITIPGGTSTTFALTPSSRTARRAAQG